MWKSVKNWLQKWTFLSGEIFLHILELSLSNVKKCHEPACGLRLQCQFFQCAIMCARFIPMCIYVCKIYSHVHLCVQHLFQCASMCASFIPIYIIYSYVHLCVHHLFQCAYMCAPFFPMCIHVCTLYSYVHLCVHHLFIPLCIFVCTLYSHVHVCVSIICAPFILRTWHSKFTSKNSRYKLYI